MEILLAPLVALLRLALEGSFRITGSYGISILIVSFLVSVGSQPMYRIAEKWQESERKVRQKLDPVLAEFRKVYKGFQLNAFEQTLYRQHQYHPIYALRNYVGILIQIPFFLAAYSLLAHWEAFRGFPFLVISDLSEPDQLLSLGQTKINLLPILMTAINLVSLYFYGKRAGLGEILRAVGLALLFLVLLYNAPSGLLLYWTSNNFFVLLRNYQMLQREPKAASELRLADQISIFFQGVASGVKALLNGTNSNSLKVAILHALLISVSIFIFCPLELIATGSTADFSSSLISLLYESSFIAVGLFVLFLIPALAARRLGANRFLVLYSLLLIAISYVVLINLFLFPPDYGEMVDFTFESRVQVTQASIILSWFLYAVAFLFAFFLFVLNESKTLLVLANITLLCFGFLSIRNAWNYSEGLGKKQHQVSQENEIISKDFRFSKNKPNVVVLVLDRFVGGYLPRILKELPEVAKEFEGFTWYPNALSSSSKSIGGTAGIMGGWEYSVHNLMTTRTDENLMDRIRESASVMPYNFDRNGFETALFSLAPGSYKDLRDFRFLQRTRIKDLSGIYSLRWGKERYGEGIEWIDNSSKLLATFALFRALPPQRRERFYNMGKWRQWHNRGHLTLRSSYTEKTHGADYLFDNVSNGYAMKRSINQWSVLYYLPRISIVEDSSTNGTFHFLHSDFTHEPQITGFDFDVHLEMPLIYPKRMLAEFENHLSSVKHFYTDGAALKAVAQWLRWMKSQEIYDNTRIIIVSDHGEAVFNPMFQKQDFVKKRYEPSSFNIIFLVKDFRQRGQMKQSLQFMTNSDTPAVAFAGLIEGVNPWTQQKIAAPENKLPFYSYRIDWRPWRIDNNRFRVFKKYRINSSQIFNSSAWSAEEK